MKMQKRFQEKLQAALDAKGWSQSDLARTMGISPQTVSQYIRGERNPGIDVAERFAVALELPDVASLLDATEIFQATA